MKELLAKNSQFLLLVFLLLIGGGMGGQLLGFVLIAVVAYLLKQKERIPELFLLLLFILVFSDNRTPLFDFAENGKVLYVILLFLFLLLDRDRLPIQSRILNYFLPFLLLALVFVFRSPQPFTAFVKTCSYGFMFFLVPNYFLLSYQEEGKEFLRKLLLMVFLILVTGLLLSLVGPEFAFHGQRFRGLFGNPNGAGIFTALFFIFLVVALHIHPDLLNKQEKWLIYGVFVITLLYCNSRSALFTVLLFLGFIPIYRASPFLGFIAFLITVMGSQFVTTNLPYIIKSLGLEDYFRIETLEEGSGRFIAWNFAWGHIEEDMMFGKGFAHTEKLYKRNYDYLASLGHQGNAHNSFLTFWLDTGLSGLIAYLIAFFAVFIRAAKQHVIAVPVMYAILFSATFESWMTASLNPFTIVFLMILSLLTYQGEGTEEEEEEDEEELEKAKKGE